MGCFDSQSLGSNRVVQLGHYIRYSGVTQVVYSTIAGDIFDISYMS